MTTLTNFFKESDSKLGVFYPQHYVIGTFPDIDKTRLAENALLRAGFSTEEVLAIPGSEVLKYFAEFRANSGLWSGVMTMLSRSFGTEQVFADDDVHLAQQGFGFLAVHCTTDDAAHRVHQLVEPFEPRSLQWYQSGGIETLI